MRIVETRAANIPSCSQEGTQRLDRNQWHRPLVSIIVTHYNYSAHLKDALLSLLDQTHDNWECVVVDDGSEQAHRSAVEAIVDDIGSAKIRALLLPEKSGRPRRSSPGLTRRAALSSACWIRTIDALRTFSPNPWQRIPTR